MTAVNNFYSPLSSVDKDVIKIRLYAHILEEFRSVVKLNLWQQERKKKVSNQEKDKGAKEGGGRAKLWR